MIKRTEKPLKLNEHVAEILRQRIKSGEFSSGSPIPSEQVLARELDVSRGTIRNAMKKLDEEGLTTTFKRCGRIVAPGPDTPTSGSDKNGLMAKTIVLFAPAPESLPPEDRRGDAEMIDLGIVDACRRKKMHVLAMDPNNLDEKTMETLIKDPPVGFIHARTYEAGKSNPLVLQWKNQTLPLVFHGNNDEVRCFDRIISDNESGTYQLTNHLIDQGKKRILCLSHAKKSYWIKSRDAGYTKAIEEAGLEAIISELEIKRFDGTRECFEIRSKQLLGFLMEFLQTDNPVDAIMGVSDEQVFPIAAACRMLGNPPGKDLDIVGYDNYWETWGERRWESYHPPASIDRQIYNLSEAMVDLLLDRITGKLPEEKQLRIVKPELVITSK